MEWIIAVLLTFMSYGKIHVVPDCEGQYAGQYHFDTQDISVCERHKGHALDKKTKVYILFHELGHYLPHGNDNGRIVAQWFHEIERTNTMSVTPYGDTFWDEDFAESFAERAYHTHYGEFFNKSTSERWDKGASIRIEFMERIMKDRVYIPRRK